MDLYQAFTNLPLAGSLEDFRALPLSVQRLDFLAKAQDGSPVFLLHDSSSASYSPPIELKYLSAQFQNTCRVVTDSNTIEDQFAVVSCDATAPELYELFIRCVAAAVERLPIGAGTDQLRDSIQELLHLFRSLARPSTREVTGLWAELFVIARSHNMLQALHAWHADQFERFDFSWPNGCLEVKATTKEQRQHEFALEQLQEPIGGRGFVVSLLLQPMSGGVGIMDLAGRIETTIAGKPKLRQKLWKNITSALGNDFSNRLDIRFNLSYAERHLAIFAMKDIPAPEQPNDSRITSIRFRVELSNVQVSTKGSTGDLLSRLFK